MYACGRRSYSFSTHTALFTLSHNRNRNKYKVRRIDSQEKERKKRKEGREKMFAHFSLSEIHFSDLSDGSACLTTDWMKMWRGNGTHREYKKDKSVRRKKE